MGDRPVVLVHGALHGAWCWAAVQAELDKRGVPSYAVDLPGHGTSTEPLRDLHGDADAVAAVVERLGEEVVLVGHSYGGSVITQAGLRGQAAHLVYLAALVPEEGESAAACLASLPGQAERPSLFTRTPEGHLMADPAGAAGTFYNTCDPQLAAAAVARLRPQRAATLKQPPTVAAWRQRPSTYIRCLQDRAIPADGQALLAQRCGTVVDLDTDHSPFFCAPAAVAAVLAPLSAR